MKSDSLTARARIRICKSPAEVFAAFADAHAMSQFWFTRRDDGLKQGERVTWFLGSGEDAFAFDVQVKELSHPNKIVILWDRDGTYTQITWTIEETEQGDSILTIEESGFMGNSDAIIEQALDSTGGFNQVIVAAKAFLEHGIGLNVVTAHV
jgi:uncharacterized protein YndB with AHSA1/START domain